MEVIVCKNYEEMSKKAAELVAECVKAKPNCILGLATGSTPIGMYEALAEMCKRGELDFSEVSSFNLDEYYPISPDNDQSYRYFMNTQLFDKINIDKSRTRVPDGTAADPAAECADYEAALKSSAGIDIQILGIGQNGHIGFNEPDTALYPETHMTDLTDDTIDANSRFFASRDDVPTKALTMGMASILRARKIILLASGKNKLAAITEVLKGRVNTMCPATLLNLHDNVVLICDEAAYPAE